MALPPGYPMDMAQPMQFARPMPPAVPMRTNPNPIASPSQRPAVPQPRFRAQGPDEQPASPANRPPDSTLVLAMPSPEQLGVAAATGASNSNWEEFHQRLDRLGAASIHREKLSDGGCRLICLFPITHTERSHRIEAAARSEAEAMRLALEKAEEWNRVVRATPE